MIDFKESDEDENTSVYKVTSLTAQQPQQGQNRIFCRRLINLLIITESM